MKGKHLFVTLLTTIMIAAAGFSSSEFEKVDFLASADVKLISDFDGLTVDFHSIELIAVPISILSPKLESNFCGLVKFPELGSEGEPVNYSRVARGPPKS